MVEDFTREVRAPVDLVIEAVREETKEWRESAIPPEVRKLGVARMKAIVQPPYFRLWLWHPGGSEEAPAMVRAVVIPTPDGGSRLRGEIGRRLRSRVAFALPLLAFVALAWTTGGVVTLVIASVISTVVALMGFAWRATLPSGSDPEAEYLMQRLARTLAAAEEKAALAAATQPGALPPLVRREPEISRADAVEARVSPNLASTVRGRIPQSMLIGRSPALGIVNHSLTLLHS